MEKDIVKGVLAYLRGLPECFCYKEHGGLYGMSGIPDVIACYRGRFVALEVKMPGGRLTKLQEATLCRIREAGGVAEVVTSMGQAKEILRVWGGDG